MNENLQPDLNAVEKEDKDKKINLSRYIFHQPTQAHSFKLRGIGFTRKNKSETKKAKKLAKSQRATNHAMKNKKHRATGSKKRK